VPCDRISIPRSGDSATPMEFYDASGKSLDMLPRSNVSTFDRLQLARRGTALADPTGSACSNTFALWVDRAAKKKIIDAGVWRFNGGGCGGLSGRVIGGIFRDRFRGFLGFPVPAFTNPCSCAGSSLLALNLNLKYYQ
jgi:hypothetical protein